jgi:protein-tyrosine phosphatase
MNPFWVETDNNLRLAIVLRPRGGAWLDDEIASIKRAGVDDLISMLEADDAAELGLSDEAAACKTAGVTFRSFPIPDQGTPQSTAKFAEFVQLLRSDLRARRSIGAHCRASIGRSSLLLAAVLCAEGFQPDDAFGRLSRARGLKVPDTEEQVAWVKRFRASIRPGWKPI